MTYIETAIAEYKKHYDMLCYHGNVFEQCLDASIATSIRNRKDSDVILFLGNENLRAIVDAIGMSDDRNVFWKEIVGSIFNYHLEPYVTNMVGCSLWSGYACHVNQKLDYTFAKKSLVDIMMTGFSSNAGTEGDILVRRDKDGLVVYVGDWKFFLNPDKQ